MNNKIYNFTPKQRKRDLRFYKLWRFDNKPLQFLINDEEWRYMSRWYYCSSAPAWYKRVKNKKLRAKLKRSLHKELKYSDNDCDVQYPLFVRNADWDWW